MASDSKRQAVIDWLTSGRQKKTDGGGDVLDWMGVRAEEKSGGKTFGELFVESLDRPGDRLKKQVEANKTPKRGPGRPVVVRGDLATMVGMLKKEVKKVEDQVKSLSSFEELDAQRKVRQDTRDFTMLISDVMDDSELTLDQKLARVKSLVDELSARTNRTGGK